MAPGFPEVVAAVGQLPDATALDGELVVWEAGRLAFERLQGRLQRRGATAARLASEWPAHFVAFDVLRLAGTNTVAWPYRRRRAALALLRQAKADVWIGGGWGIDALIGEQTRDHRDLDLMHRQDQETAVSAALHEAGFVETLDWRPIRFVVTALDGREIDLHPLVFADDGSAVQASPEPERPFTYPSSCFVTGTGCE